jgi:hypothetical protein
MTLLERRCGAKGQKVASVRHLLKRRSLHAKLTIAFPIWLFKIAHLFVFQFHLEGLLYKPDGFVAWQGFGSFDVWKLAIK